MRPGFEQVGFKIIKWIQSILVTIYVLELVGATAVTSLGWAACQILVGAQEHDLFAIGAGSGGGRSELVVSRQ
jgi:hypothetical protein